MRQHHHVLALPTTCGSILPGEIAALADIKNLAETVSGEFLLPCRSNRTSSTSLLGEKSRGTLQYLAFLPQDFVFPT